ncbi:MAG: 2-succinyl-5-enolpyruvyl-6-hydroxy-3-cyclohexene-1-carboxylic-acid synthase [Prevotella conceptionensis]
MYSNKENINILTSLLVAHGVRRAVVCPGSRNAPIVHNLVKSGAISCYPVTDERSAGFYALGMALLDGDAVAVCVTSGSALLNLLPAVAEAYYQHIPLIVISADRPLAWIDQQDGQTIRQQNSLADFVKKAVTLNEPTDETQRWHCNRLANEALLATNHHGVGPVHINVPLSEPLFKYDVTTLPNERMISRYTPSKLAATALNDLMADFRKAERPMIVLGQMPPGSVNASLVKVLEGQAVVVSEVLSYLGGLQNADELLATCAETAPYTPDFVLYMGGHLIGKNLKSLLRQMHNAPQWLVNEGGEVVDTFMNLTAIVEAKPNEVLSLMVQMMQQTDAKQHEERTKAFRQLWQTGHNAYREQLNQAAPTFSEGYAVQCFEQQLQQTNQPFEVHYANSLSVRLANKHAQHHVWCNRGVNGIEGSLSTSAGMSLTTQANVYCVIGDLSFFYDQNALWNTRLGGNLRIMLLNNGGGKIFQHVKGMPADDIQATFVSATHNTLAQGICQQNGARYLLVNDIETLQKGIAELIGYGGNRPFVLEVNLT